MALLQIDFLIETFSKTDGRPTDPKPTFFKASGNITSSFMFGVHYDDHDDPEFVRLLEGIDNW